MARRANNSVMDAALAVIATGNIMTVCNAEPTTRTEAVTTYALADVVPTFTGPANGSPSGRQISVDQKVNVPIDTSGTANHVAICDGSNLLYVTVCVSQSLTAGGTVTLPAWTATILAPAAP
jgi:hypothetical protein